MRRQSSDRDTACPKPQLAGPTHDTTQRPGRLSRRLQLTEAPTPAASLATPPNRPATSTRRSARQAQFRTRPVERQDSRTAPQARPQSPDAPAQPAPVTATSHKTSGLRHPGRQPHRGPLRRRAHHDRRQPVHQPQAPPTRRRPQRPRRDARPPVRHLAQHPRPPAPQPQHPRRPAHTAPRWSPPRGRPARSHPAPPPTTPPPQHSHGQSAAPRARSSGQGRGREGGRRSRASPPRMSTDTQP